MLTLLNPGPAPPEALERGLAAAAASLAASGIDPEAAWLNNGYHQPWIDSIAMRAWYRAEDAAVRAAYGSWRLAPLGVALEWQPLEAR